VKKTWLPPTEDDNGDPITLTDEQIKKLTDRSFNYCVWALGQSAKTRKQLADALAKKDVPTDIIETVLDRMTELGYLNDAAFADTFTRNRHEFHRKGSRVIRQELRRKGVSDDLIEAAVETIDPEQETENARTLVAKKLGSTRGLDRNKRVNRLAGMLMRKGYSGSDVFDVIREALDAEANGEEFDPTG
jgi:regulatory protein